MRIPTLKHALLLALAATLVAGCTTASLKELRRTAPKGSAFQAALSALYLEYAESEAAQYDWYHSQYFADKGLLAAYGNDTPPEKLENWELPADKLPEMQRAREALLAYLGSATQANPQSAAKAQYYFDCWVEQQQEMWQVDDIESCRQGLVGILAQPVAIAPQAVLPAEVTPLPETPQPAPLPAAAAPATTSYVLFFDKGTRLLPDSARVLDGVVAELTKRGAYTVILNGHTDREGAEQANTDLSQKRLDAVKARLVQAGLDPARIQTFAFGETDPAVATADGIAEPANRRVELFINP